MNDKNLVKNIKILVVFFSICFFGIISYLTYFNVAVAENIKNDNSNKRVRIDEIEVIRGSICDRDGNTLVYSEKDSKGNQKRKYKNASVYAHITGYLSYVYGRTGIEEAYNDELLGKTFNYNAVAAFFRTLKEEFTDNDKKGGNVWLTIDNKTQEAGYKTLGSDKGAAVAINPSTGEVLALVSKPSYDPQNIDSKFADYQKDTEGNPFVNRAVQGYYPPGSVFKIITAASALENINNITNQYFTCTGKLKIGDYKLTEHGGAVHGKVDIRDAFRLSCNYTFGSIGMKLGYDVLENTAEKFMFNNKIDTSDKAGALNIKAGKITIEDKKSSALLAQDAIGQHGVTANPMDMALVTSAIANNGVIMKPYIVKQITDRYNVVLDTTNNEILSTAVSSKTAEEIKKYMVDTVKNGTGKSARISGISVAGKTGSAENEKGEETHSWFVAFAPAEKPQIAVAVIVENAGKGGGRAAEIAREMIKAYLK
jgi:peptidoglycan glycosyltransferase